MNGASSACFVSHCIPSSEWGAKEEAAEEVDGEEKEDAEGVDGEEREDAEGVDAGERVVHIASSIILKRGAMGTVLERGVRRVVSWVGMLDLPLRRWECLRAISANMEAATLSTLCHTATVGECSVLDLVGEEVLAIGCRRMMV